MKLIRSNRCSSLKYPIWAQPILRAKRWVALIGIASLCLTAPSMFFWDRILAGLPVTSANFLVYRLSRALAGNRPPGRKEVTAMLEWIVPPDADEPDPDGFCPFYRLCPTLCIFYSP
ncbi:MAG: hypothetical protein ACOYW4_00525 [Bacillota bacterium]